MSETASIPIHSKKKKLTRKKVYVPFGPQPPKSDVLEVHRLYQIPEASPKGPLQYRRKITWLENIPFYLEYLPSTAAVVEYTGNFPNRKHHGKTKDNDKNTKYVRTKPKVTKKLKSLLKQEPIKNVERKMNQEAADDYEKQRNYK